MVVRAVLLATIEQGIALRHELPAFGPLSNAPQDYSEKSDIEHCYTERIRGSGATALYQLLEDDDTIT